VNEQYAQIARRLATEHPQSSPSERLEAVARAMEEAGYMAEWKEAEGNFHFTVHNCAIQAVAQHLPEVCAREETFLRSHLEAGVERQTPIMDGCNACEYKVTFDEGGEARLSQLSDSPRNES
jgi:predicted ArsR family transcriptional regulator